MAVRIVTDSTADLPPALVRAHQIVVVPLNVHFGQQTFRDGVDLTTDAFFARLPHAQVLPTTSQPSAGAFFAVYQSLLDAGHEVLSLHISGKLSGTMNSALLAQRDLPAGAPLTIVDTQFASMALGLVVLEAARAVQAGGSRAEAEQAARRAMAATQVRFFVDTLEYLQRGGRIGRAQAFLGSLLSFKPVITLRDGEVHPVERVRTRSRAVQHLFDWAAGIHNAAELCVLYSTTADEAADLKERLAAPHPGCTVHLAQIGPVIGVHMGPGAMGVVVREGRAAP